MSFSLYERARELGAGLGCGLVGRAYAEVLGVEPNPTESSRYYGMACDRGIQDACPGAGRKNLLEHMLEFGP